MIEPIVEYLPLEPAESRRGANWEIFNHAPNGISRHYLREVRELMQKSRGIYIFYDSRACALYVGKTEKRDLWFEANQAYNRDRKDHQEILLVGHPENNVTKIIRDRKISRTEVRLHDIASYISVYAIRDEQQIPQMEAILIRAFANNLLNKKIESFRLAIEE